MCVQNAIESTWLRGEIGEVMGKILVVVMVLLLLLSLSCSLLQGIMFVVANPTYEELQEFLEEDTTDSNKYIPGEYVCLHFAAHLDNNAEEKGLRCGFVFLKHSSPNGGVYGHFMNCFQTTDRGLVYINPETDREVNVEIGKKYHGGITQEIVIIW